MSVALCLELCAGMGKPKCQAVGCPKAGGKVLPDGYRQHGWRCGVCQQPKCQAFGGRRSDTSTTRGGTSSEEVHDAPAKRG